MARPPRTYFIYKRINKLRNLPQPSLRRVEYDGEELGATPETFEHPLDNPPKLWVVWRYKDIHVRTRREITDVLRQIFGKEFRQFPKMTVVKNTPYYNELLWRVKHLIEINPIVFPNGEPSEQDINRIRLLPNGECSIDDKNSVDEQLLKTSNEQSKEVDEKEMTACLLRHWHRYEEIQEDAPWTFPHRSDL